MISTVITPDTEDISIHLPPDYVGYEIEVRVYKRAKLVKDRPVKKTLRDAGLWGALNLTEERYNELQQHAKDIRNEWDRDI